ncbi:MAG TPA: F0F1 ATP synthase subunit epsilon [Streptosporangiaceae bacterium]
MTLRVEVVVADRELWAGEAGMVIAKTLEGDIGVLTGHPPVLGILAEGSLVRILDPQGPSGGTGPGGEVTAAVSGGFLSVADDQISILAVDAQLGTEVDTSAARSDLDTALSDPDSAPGAGAQEPAGARYARAQLRAAGEQA